MKSIKYYLEFIKENSEEIRLIPENVDGVKFYHGTIDFEIKDPKDINPLFRETEEYQKYQQDNIKKRRSGSSSTSRPIRRAPAIPRISLGRSPMC